MVAVWQGAPGSIRRSRQVLVIMALAVGVVACGIVVPTLRARPGEPVAAVFPPGWTAEASLRAVAGTPVRIIGVGPLPNVVMVSADTAEDLVQLYEAGAWSLLGAGGGFGCFGAALAQDSES